jgi:quinoprotein glucose dehydrogenase
LAAAVEQSLADNDPLLRSAAREVLMDLKPAEGFAKVKAALASGQLVEQQRALAALKNSPLDEASTVIDEGLARLLSGQWPAALELDLLEAAARRIDRPIKDKLAKFEAARSQEDVLAEYRETLAGGDAERGRRIFFERAEVSCVRCHKAQGTGGDVGPELTKVAADKTREYLLESLVAPSKTIAKNFESVLVITEDGQQHSGIIKSEDDRTLSLMTAEGRLVSVDKATIEERAATKSAMPEDLPKKLTKREVRDLVEYLSTLK